MHITVKTTNFALTEAIAAYVESRLAPMEKLTQRAEARDQDEVRGTDPVLARVEVGKTTNHHKKGDVFQCVVQLEIPGEPNLRAESVQEDLHAAIDAVRDELERELKRSQSKQRDSVIKGGRELKERMHRES